MHGPETHVTLAPRSGQLVFPKNPVEAREITQHPKLSDLSRFKSKQRRSQPMNGLAGWRQSSECAGVNPRESHLRKGTIAVGNAFKNLATIIAQAAANRTDIIGKRLAPA